MSAPLVPLSTVPLVPLVPLSVFPLLPDVPPLVAPLEPASATGVGSVVLEHAAPAATAIPRTTTVWKSFEVCMDSIEPRPPLIS